MEFLPKIKKEQLPPSRPPRKRETPAQIQARLDASFAEEVSAKEKKRRATVTRVIYTAVGAGIGYRGSCADLGMSTTPEKLLKGQHCSESVFYGYTKKVKAGLALNFKKGAAYQISQESLKIQKQKTLDAKLLCEDGIEEYQALSDAVRTTRLNKNLAPRPPHEPTKFVKQSAIARLAKAGVSFTLPDKSDPARQEAGADLRNPVCTSVGIVCMTRLANGDTMDPRNIFNLDVTGNRISRDGTRRPG
jgi:hypothetical protein